jgi:hypothetical protein
LDISSGLFISQEYGRNPYSNSAGGALNLNQNGIFWMFLQQNFLEIEIEIGKTEENDFCTSFEEIPTRKSRNCHTLNITQGSTE